MAVLSVPETLLLPLALPGLHILFLPLALGEARPTTLSGSKPLGHAAWIWAILRAMHLTLAWGGSPRLLVLIGRLVLHPRPVILGAADCPAGSERHAFPDHGWGPLTIF